ncbi:MULTISPECIES: hypothetical protein [Persicobacter]|uniref:RING-type E3 ubiquitin transferase n=1 Tax=Persicobacter diffluens TaxID=981 RepID=A0AAN4VZE6_9BACT|nr:hypothetical protein [Persicobacter sp. CCB-QB2]GJM61876.1 hypothetical protein PEDI_24280 [Persicobacter diffluens]
MNVEYIFFGFIGFIILGFIIFSHFFTEKAIVKRKLKKAPLKKIKNFRNGQTARIVGQVVPVNEALKAPLSGRACAEYHVEVQQKKSQGKSSKWVKVIDDQKSIPFLIKEGDHFAIIEASEKRSYIVKDAKFDSGFLNDASPKLKQYLKNHGHDDENWLGMNKSFKYHEGILEPGEKIAVYGEGRWVTAQELELPEAFGKILVMQSGMDALYISDDPDTLQFEKKKESY